MKKRFEPGLFIILCAAWLQIAGAVNGGEPSELRRLRATYETQLKKIDADLAKAEVHLQEGYIKALGSLEKKLQDAGKLEPLLHTREERTRFRKERRIPAARLPADNPALLKLQSDYLATLKKLPLDYAQRTITLTGQYERSLMGLQKSLTKKGHVEAAIEVKKERDALEARPNVTAARFALADAASQQPAPAPPETAALPDVAPPPEPVMPAKKPSTLSLKYSGAPKNRVQKRYNNFCKVIEKQKWNAAITYVDPQVVKQMGKDAVETRLKFVFPLVRHIKDHSRKKLKAGSVTLDDDEKTATLIPRVWSGKEWHDLASVTWILVEGDWYLEMKAGKAPAPKPWGRRGKRRPRR